MRNHLNLGNVKPDEVPEDSVKAVAETLKKSTSLKVSEDGESWALMIPMCSSAFVYCPCIPYHIFRYLNISIVLEYEKSKKNQGFIITIETLFSSPLSCESIKGSKFIDVIFFNLSDF